MDSSTFEDIVIPVTDIEIQRLVGSGGYGDVWKAVWKGRGGGLVVAVKKIRVSAFNTNTKREIYEEVHILRRLRYRHVLQIYGVCITDNHELWMVLDFIDGGNLYEYLKLSLDISLATRLKFMLQAALAINYLHSGKPQILHRDLKSPNFLISKDTLDIKLTDFGTSKITSVATNTTSSARSSATVGSHRWAAPETTSMNPVWTEKSDIYSLGMTFYEIVTGRIPFDQVTENYKVMYLVIQDKARPPIPQDCPRELNELISRCWHHEPEKRPSSQEVVKILSDLTNSPTFASIPAAPIHKGRKFFEVNEDLLLRTVSPECITTLTAPPHFPGNPQEAANLKLPKQVKVVVLKKSNINPLISNTYDVQIFDRVEVYFRRFFAAQDSMKVTLDQVDVVFNPSIEQRFRDAEEALHNSCKGVEEFIDPKQTDLQRDYLSHLLPSENLYKNRNSNPISVWHGANSNKTQSIQWYGMLNLTSTDPGYFGKAMYFTQYPKYGEYFAAQLQDRTEGRFNLLLCWALLGKPWAQTKVNMGAPCQKGYTSHYTVVTKKRAHEDFCEDKNNYEMVKGLENYFPVLLGEQVKGDEIALFNPSHVLPRFIVHYTVEKNQTDFVLKPRGDSTIEKTPSLPPTTFNVDSKIMQAFDSNATQSSISTPALPPTTSPSYRSKRSAQRVLIIHSSLLHYDLKNELGMGAQGIAYCAKWKSREVVFKKLAVRYLHANEKREFMRELEVWRNINHPNAISLYGAVDDSGKLGYVMEYCHNGNLRDCMQAGLVLGPKKTIDFACDIAGILSFLHESSIVHRDIKSSNVMLDRDFRPKLGDFGLSRMLSTIQASATNMAGTPTHMAPEQFVDGGKHDPMKADVYSFGMLLYELATNKIPFFGLSQFGISENVKKGERPPILDKTPIGMNESERKMWWNIVTKCWSQEPHFRPSMDEVSLQLCDLQNIVSSRIQGFCCKAHKTGQHDYFLSFRVSTESSTVHKLYDALSSTTRKSGETLKVFLAAKCLPDAEDWQKSFLYGLHNSKIMVPIISASGLTHFQKAHEENDNVLLEYEHMLSLLKLHKGNVKIFPLFVGTIPRASDFPDKPHIMTGKSIQQTLKGILQLRGKSMGTMDEVVAALLDKLDELYSGANTHLTLTTHEARMMTTTTSVPVATTATTAATSTTVVRATTTTVSHNQQNNEEEKVAVFIQVEGESLRDDHVEISPSSSLQVLRKLILEQLDDFDFEYKFTQKLNDRISTINFKQETIKAVKDIITNYSITVRKI